MFDGKLKRVGHPIILQVQDVGLEQERVQHFRYGRGRILKSLQLIEIPRQLSVSAPVT